MGQKEITRSRAIQSIQFNYETSRTGEQAYRIEVDVIALVLDAGPRRKLDSSSPQILQQLLRTTPPGLALPLIIRYHVLL